jgi:hypothetical protein
MWIEDACPVNHVWVGGNFGLAVEIFPLASINLGKTKKNQLVLGLQISLFYNFVLGLQISLFINLGEIFPLASINLRIILV